MTLQTLPELEVSLAVECVNIPYPEFDDYDAWQEWITGKVLPAYKDCSKRHATIVEEWKKMVDKQKAARSSP